MLLMSMFDSCDTGDWATANHVNPMCHLVTTAVNMVKSSNAQKNAENLIDLLGLETAVIIDGGTSDNAPDALKEQEDSPNIIYDMAEKSDDVTIRSLVYINGVRCV